MGHYKLVLGKNKMPKALHKGSGIPAIQRAKHQTFSLPEPVFLRKFMAIADV